MEQIQASPIFLGLSSQKGGVGKSTLAEIVSSILYYEKGIHFFAVDCDLSQDSFYKLREREKACIESDPQLSKQMKQYFSSLGVQPIAYLRQILRMPLQRQTIISENIRRRSSIWSSSTFPVMQVPVTFCNSRWIWTISFRP